MTATDTYGISAIHIRYKRKKLLATESRFTISLSSAERRESENVHGVWSTPNPGLYA
jgi:hypothetical protein